METDTKQKSNNEFGHWYLFKSIIELRSCYKIYMSIAIVFNFCVCVFFRSPKLQELINLIQDAKVDEVESWLQTNIPSKQKVPFLSIICFILILYVQVHRSQPQKKTQYIDIHRNFGSCFLFCHKTYTTQNSKKFWISMTKMVNLHQFILHVGKIMLKF